jgi:hypothetical protein
MKQNTKVFPLLVDEQEVAVLEKAQLWEYGKPVVDIDKLRDQLKDIKNGLVGVFEDKDRQDKFALNSLEVGLTIGAEGGIWFIAKGSVQGSIKLTFKRNEPGKSP